MMSTYVCMAESVNFHLKRNARLKQLPLAAALAPANTSAGIPAFAHALFQMRSKPVGQDIIAFSGVKTPFLLSLFAFLKTAVARKL